MPWRVRRAAHSVMTATRAMRIACIAPSDLRTDRRARAHARALGAAGHEVTLFGVQSRGAEPEEEDGPVVLVRTPLPGWTRDRGAASCWRAARRARRYEPVVRAAVARGAFDAYHAFGIDVAGPVADAARDTGARFVLDDDGTSRLDVAARAAAELPAGARRAAVELRIAYLRRGEERVQRDVRGAADLVVAASRDLADDARERWGGPRGVVVHDSFVASPRRRADRLRARLGVYPGDRVVAVRDEGAAAAVAVRALRILGEGHVLALLGWSRPAADVMAVAAEEGLSQRVRLLPPAPEAEILELCASADAVVLPAAPGDRAARLTVPRSFFECLAAAVPVVAPDLPAVGRLVRDTGAGVLYPGRAPADPGAVAEALRTVLAEPSLAAACGDRARAALAGGLSWERQAARLLDAYAQLAQAV